MKELIMLFSALLLLAIFRIVNGYLLFAIAIAVVAVSYYQYTKCAYYLITKNSPLQLYFDKGKLGEYMTYKRLKNMEREGAKFLFNLYIPKGEDETTEIDVLMLHPKGMFVFESKNYSGWIFGSEHQRNWYQTLPQGRGKSHKEVFYNPVMQNRTHIKHLKELLGDAIPMYSIITFSERCTLKKVDIQTQDVQVINRQNVRDVVMSICAQYSNTLLSEDQIQELFDKLYPHTQVDAAVKLQHVENIEKKIEPVITPTVAVEQEQPVQTESNQERKCPKCGGLLVLRRAAKGANAGNQFYGCSNYPKCRFIQSVSQNEK